MPSPSPSRMNGYAGWLRVTGALLRLVRSARRRRPARRWPGAGGRLPRRTGRDPEAFDRAGLGGGDRGRGARRRAGGPDEDAPGRGHAARHRGWRSAAMVARYSSAVDVEDGAVARLLRSRSSPLGRVTRRSAHGCWAGCETIATRGWSAPTALPSPSPRTRARKARPRPAAARTRGVRASKTNDDGRRPGRRRLGAAQPWSPANASAVAFEDGAPAP